MADKEEEEQSFVSSDAVILSKSTKFSERRLDYSSPIYQDLWCAVIYYLSLVLMIASSIYLWTAEWPAISAHNDSINNSNNGGSPSSSSSTWTDLEYTGFCSVLLVAPLMGLLFGFLWLQILRKWAKSIIIALLFLNMALWGIVSVILFFVNEVEGGMVALILCLFLVLYTWCIWGRIQLAGVLLVECALCSSMSKYPFYEQQALGARMVSVYHGVVWVQLFSVVLSIFWFFVIALTLWGYVVTTAAAGTVDGEGAVDYEYSPNEAVLFLMLLLRS